MTPDQAWRQEDDRGIALKITTEGQEAIGIDATPRQADPKIGQTDSDHAAPEFISATASALSTIRPGTKQARLLAMLERKEGAAIDALVSELGWQAHTA